MRRTWGSLALGLTTAAFGLGFSAPQALAATGDFGHQDGSFAGVANVTLANATADKPQSKLWFNDGFWWADMFSPASGSWRIFKLNRTTSTWTDTGTAIDSRPSTRGDTLWDGTHLYIAHQVVAANSAANVKGQPAKLYRYSYSASTKKYTLDAGFPVKINDVSSESLTIDKDSRGALWATWTQGQKVYVNTTNGADNTWGTPFTLGGSGASGLTSDDISAVVAYGKSKIGVMWSNQAKSSFYFASHADGAARGVWTVSTALSGSAMADDHLDLKTDATGRLFAAVKTGQDLTASTSAVQTMVLGLDPATGIWQRASYGTVDDCHTRPVLAVDSTNQRLHVFSTAPSTSSGCPHSGTPGTIYDKSSPLTKLAFTTGRGTPVIRQSSSAWMNDVTGSKQPATAASGLVMLASNTSTQQYWHADISLTPPKPPVKPAAKPTVNFKSVPASKKAWSTIRFTGTGTGGVTTWTWNFGDKKTAAGRTPSHKYAKAGRYKVTVVGKTAKGVKVTLSRVIVVKR